MDRDDLIDELMINIDRIETAINDIEEISNKYHEDYKLDALKSLDLFRNKLQSKVEELEMLNNKEFQEEWNL